MDLNKQVRSVTSRSEFAAFVRIILEDLRENPDSWENADLESFLEAMAAWVDDMEGYYQNRNESVPSPSWRLFGEILLAARIYE